jgi:Rieske Fe-S protein
MNPSFSRRFFIEGCAATLGLTLIGCNSGGTNDGPLVATVGDNGAFVVENVPEIKINEAVPFQFQGGDFDKKPGLIFNSALGLAAIDAVCTHSGCTVEWTNNMKSPLRCPCHESTFTLQGEVVSGPAPKPLPTFSVQKQGSNLLLIPV